MIDFFPEESPAAILAVHLAGWPCEMDALMDLAEQHGFYVIEDWAQAHGARYRDRIQAERSRHVACRASRAPVRRSIARRLSKRAWTVRVQGAMLQ